MVEPPKVLTETVPLLPHPIDPTWSSPAIRFWQKNFPREKLPQPAIKPPAAREKWSSQLRELSADPALAEKVAFTIEAEARIIKAIQDSRVAANLLLPYLSEELPWFAQVFPGIQKPILLKYYFHAVVRHAKLGPRAVRAPIKTLGPIRVEPLAKLPPVRVPTRAP
jgi:hypothetical protein